MDPEHRGCCCQRKHGPDEGHHPALPAQEGLRGARRLNQTQVHLQWHPLPGWTRGGREGEAASRQAEGGNHP